MTNYETKDEFSPLPLRYWVLRYIHNENIKGIIGVYDSCPYRYFRFINTNTPNETLMGWSYIIQDYAKEVSIAQVESYIAMKCMQVFRTFSKREKDGSLSLVVIIDG